MHALIYCVEGVGVYSEISSGVVWVRSVGVLSCVVCWRAVVFCAPGRVAGWVCLGVFPTWCSIVGADTGSMKNGKKVLVTCK